MPYYSSSPPAADLQASATLTTSLASSINHAKQSNAYQAVTQTDRIDSQPMALPTPDNTSTTSSSRSATMDDGVSVHDPSTWPITKLLGWLSDELPAVSSRISAAKGKPPSLTILIVAVLELVHQQPDLCVAGHEELWNKVVAKYSPKRVSPTLISADVTVNPVFAVQDDPNDSMHEDFEDDDNISEISLEMEHFAPNLNTMHGFRPEWAYKQMFKDFREIQHKHKLRNEDRAEAPAILSTVYSDKKLEIDEEEDLMPLNDEDDNLSQISETFWKELEEEDQQPQSNAGPTLDYTQIINDEVTRMQERWIHNKLPRCQNKAHRLWSTYRGTSERIRAADVKERIASHLSARLDKLKSTVQETVLGLKENSARRQCASLEQTVFDHQKAMYERDMLRSPDAPTISPAPAKHVKFVSSVRDDDDSDPDAISLDSDSESETFEPTSPADSSTEVPASATNQDASRASLYMPPHFISSEVDAVQAQSPSLQEAGMEDGPENDMSEDTEHEIEQMPPNEIEVDTPLAATTRQHSEIVEDEADLVTLINSQQPGGLKRKKNFHQSQESKRHQSDAIKRQKEDEARTQQNSRYLMHAGDIAINPGKQQDEEFVFINETTCKVLKEHQVDGVRFLWREIVREQDDSQAAGCLLSHTMGLGKTMQVITLLRTIMEAANGPKTSKLVPPSLRQSRTLILCHPGLVANWQAEFKKWVPEEANHLLGRVETLAASATRHERLQYWQDHGGVLIVGYNLFRAIVIPKHKNIQTQEITNILLTTATIVVADEAHSLKNETSSARLAVDQLSCRRRIALTGSPLSNSIHEYWSMIEWVSPGYLGPSKEFRTMFERPITDGSYLESTDMEEKMARIALETLERVLKPKIHRRDATVLKDTLPPKREFIIKTSLTAVQKELYTRYITCLRGGSGGQIAMGAIWSAGKNLTMISNHPAIFSRQQLRSATQANLAKGGTEDLTVLEPSLLRTLALEYNDDDARSSYKVLSFLRIVEAAMQVGDKTLLFTQSLKTLEYLSEQLAALGIGHDKLAGDTEIAKRSEMLAAFNHSVGVDTKSVLLISTRTGNAGFNIHGANRVVIFDFDWNPTYDEQAIGRAYRLGQKKNVFVYRFVSDGTFESALLNQTARKTQLSVQVVERKHTQNVVSKIGQKYLALPTETVPLNPFDLEHWRKIDNVLASVLDLNLEFAHHRTPFITDLLDAEVFRAERQPEPLSNDSQKYIDEWVARCQRGDWAEKATPYAGMANEFAYRQQMADIAPSHYRVGNISYSELQNQLAYSPQASITPVSGNSAFLSTQHASEANAMIGLQHEIGTPVIIDMVNRSTSRKRHRHRHVPGYPVGDVGNSFDSSNPGKPQMHQEQTREASYSPASDQGNEERRDIRQDAKFNLPINETLSRTFARTFNSQSAWEPGREFTNDLRSLQGSLEQQADKTKTPSEKLVIDLTVDDPVQSPQRLHVDHVVQPRPSTALQGKFDSPRLDAAQRAAQALSRTPSYVVPPVTVSSRLPSATHTHSALATKFFSRESHLPGDKIAPGLRLAPYESNTLYGEQNTGPGVFGSMIPMSQIVSPVDNLESASDPVTDHFSQHAGDDGYSPPKNEISFLSPPRRIPAAMPELTKPRARPRFNSTSMPTNVSRQVGQSVPPEASRKQSRALSQASPRLERSRTAAVDEVFNFPSYESLFASPSVNNEQSRSATPITSNNVHTSVSAPVGLQFATTQLPRQYNQNKVIIREDTQGATHCSLADQGALKGLDHQMAHNENSMNSSRIGSPVARPPSRRRAVKQMDPRFREMLFDMYPD